MTIWRTNTQRRKENHARRCGHIANSIKRVTQLLGHEQGAICGHDLVMQWAEGGDELLQKTRDAWEDHILCAQEGAGSTTTERHGAWVPAIPM